MSARAIPLSAPTPEALVAVVPTVRAALPEGLDAAMTAAARSTGPHRLALVAKSPDDLAAQLDQLEAGHDPSGALRGQAGAPRVALLFTGQGAQYPGMAQGLAAAYPAFRRHLDAVCAALDAHLPGPLGPVLIGQEGAGSIHHTAWTQPALFAVEVALARFLGQLRVAPTAVLGHSIGELAAAHVAGVFSLDDAARLVVARGRLMGALPEGGAMVAFRADAATVAAALEGVDGVDVAGLNAPNQTVISGEVGPVEAVAAALADQGVRGARLTVSHAFHSLRMDPMLDDFRAVAATIRYAPPAVALVSNRTGAVVPAGDTSAGGPTTPDYWVGQVRGAVRFTEDVAALESFGVDLALEVGPHPVLAGLCRSGGLAAPAAPLLRRKREDTLLFAKGVAAAWAAGCTLDWGALSAR